MESVDEVGEVDIPLEMMEWMLMNENDEGLAQDTKSKVSKPSSGDRRGKDLSTGRKNNSEKAKEKQPEKSSINKSVPAKKNSSQIKKSSQNSPLRPKKNVSSESVSDTASVLSMGNSIKKVTGTKSQPSRSSTKVHSSGKEEKICIDVEKSNFTSSIKVGPKFSPQSSQTSMTSKASVKLSSTSPKVSNLKPSFHSPTTGKPQRTSAAQSQIVSSSMVDKASTPAKKLNTTASTPTTKTGRSNTSPANKKSTHAVSTTRTEHLKTSSGSATKTVKEGSAKASENAKSNSTCVSKNTDVGTRATSKAGKSGVTANPAEFNPVKSASDEASSFTSVSIHVSEETTHASTIKSGNSDSHKAEAVKSNPALATKTVQEASTSAHSANLYSVNEVITSKSDGAALSKPEADSKVKMLKPSIIPLEESAEKVGGQKQLSTSTLKGKEEKLPQKGENSSGESHKKEDQNKSKASRSESDSQKSDPDELEPSGEVQSSLADLMGSVEDGTSMNNDMEDISDTELFETTSSPEPELLEKTTKVDAVSSMGDNSAHNQTQKDSDFAGKTTSTAPKRESQSLQESPAAKKIKLDQQSNLSKAPVAATQKPGTSVATRRIVRRFHRTTQTTVQPKSSRLIQCMKPFDNPNQETQVNLFDKSQEAQANFQPSLPLEYNFSQDVLKVVAAFVNFRQNHLLSAAPYKYGISFGPILSLDLDKPSFRDETLKKADSYNLSFIEKESGIVELFFDKEDHFSNMMTQIRRTKFGARYLAVTYCKAKEDNDRESEGCYKVTVVYDQNFASTSFLSYYKAPFWNKPKSEETLSIFNIPAGIPLEFLKAIIPDAITLEATEKSDITQENSRVLLGLNRKTGCDIIMNLFTKMYIDHREIIFAKGIVKAEDIPEMKEILNESRKQDSKPKFVEKEVESSPHDINEKTDRLRRVEIIEVMADAELDKHLKQNTLQKQISAQKTSKLDSSALSDVSDDLSDISDTPIAGDKAQVLEPYFQQGITRKDLEKMGSNVTKKEEESKLSVGQQSSSKSKDEVLETQGTVEKHKEQKFEPRPRERVREMQARHRSSERQDSQRHRQSDETHKWGSRVTEVKNIGDMDRRETGVKNAVSRDRRSRDSGSYGKPHEFSRDKAQYSASAEQKRPYDRGDGDGSMSAKERLRKERLELERQEKERARRIECRKRALRIGSDDGDDVRSLGSRSARSRSNRGSVGLRDRVSRERLSRERLSRERISRERQGRSRSPFIRRVIRRRSASPKRAPFRGSSLERKRYSPSDPPEKIRCSLSPVRRIARKSSWSPTPKSGTGTSVSPIVIGDELTGGMWLMQPPFAQGRELSGGSSSIETVARRVMMSGKDVRKPGSQGGPKNLISIAETSFSDSAKAGNRQPSEGDRPSMDKFVDHVLSLTRRSPGSSARSAEILSKFIPGFKEKVNEIKKQGVNFLSSSGSGQGDNRAQGPGVNQPGLMATVPPLERMNTSDFSANAPRGGGLPDFNTNLPRRPQSSQQQQTFPRLTQSPSPAREPLPPPIPPPVAPPLFNTSSSSSSGDRITQMEAIAKQLASDIQQYIVQKSQTSETWSVSTPVVSMEQQQVSQPQQAPRPLPAPVTVPPPMSIHQGPPISMGVVSQFHMAPPPISAIPPSLMTLQPMPSPMSQPPTNLRGPPPPGGLWPPRPNFF